MFRYSKSRYNRWPRSYTPYKRGYSSSGTKARAYGAARAAKTGSKIEYFNCTVNGVATIQFEAKENYSHVFCFYPNNGGVDSKTGIIQDEQHNFKYGAIVNDRSFRMKCASFDEVRLVSMKVKLQPSAPPEGTQFTVYSICDRKADVDEVDMDDTAMTDINNDAPSVREICESAGAVPTTLNGNRIYPIVRSINCRDLMEKSVYTDASVEYYIKTGENPLSVLSMKELFHFSPAIYFCVKSSSAAVAKITTGWTYTVEYNCIFRNPKSDLQTFIQNEVPEYVTPAGRSSYIYEPSTEEGIPGRILNSRGRELNVSIWARQLARENKKKYERGMIITPTRKIEVIPVEEKETKKEPLDVEDDPGTS